MAMKNFSGGGSGTGISAKGDASAAKSVANSGNGSQSTNKPQSSYNSEAQCSQVDMGKAGGKDYNSERDGK